MRTNIKHTFIAHDNTIRKHDITYSNIDSKLGEPDTMFIMVDGFSHTDTYEMVDVTNQPDLLNFERFKLTEKDTILDDNFRIFIINRIKKLFDRKINVLLIDECCGDHIKSIIEELGSTEFNK